MGSERGARPRPRKLDRQPLARRAVLLLAICLVGLGCSERLTPARAGTIIRHSKAFLSGVPETQPVFDGVSALLSESGGPPPEGKEGDAYIALFSYHWPDRRSANGSGPPFQELTAKIFLRRSGNGWAVDDDRSKTLVPSWPQLPRTPGLSWPGEEGVHASRPPGRLLGGGLD